MLVRSVAFLGCACGLRVVGGPCSCLRCRVPLVRAGSRFGPGGVLVPPGRVWGR